MSLPSWAGGNALTFLSAAFRCGAHAGDYIYVCLHIRMSHCNCIYITHPAHTGWTIYRTIMCTVPFMQFFASRGRLRTDVRYPHGWHSDVLRGRCIRPVQVTWRPASRVEIHGDSGARSGHLRCHYGGPASCSVFWAQWGQYGTANWSKAATVKGAGPFAFPYTLQH